MYDEGNSIHNIFHDYTRFDPTTLPTIAGSTYEFKLGGSCGGVVIKLFKVYKHLYSASLVSLMRRDDYPIEYIIAYFQLGEWGSAQFVEATSGN